MMTLPIGGLTIGYRSLAYSDRQNPGRRFQQDGDVLVSQIGSIANIATAGRAISILVRTTVSDPVMASG
jgi:hypothetical protein